MRWSDVADLRWKDLRKLDREDLLRRIGLEEHGPAGDFLGGLGLFALGMLVGAGLGILFAPKPGAEMRSRISETVRSRGGRAVEEMGQHLGMESSPPPSTRIS
jgi:hypothetical protein